MSLSKLLFIDVEDDTVESVSVESFNVDPEPAPEPWLKDEPAWLRESQCLSLQGKRKKEVFYR